MDKKTSLKINNRKETMFGLASIGLGIFSGIMFVWVVYQTAYYSMGREILLGTVELLAMLLCLVGLVFGILGETRFKRFRVSAHIGIVLNVLIGIFHVMVLIKGYS